MGDQEKAGGSVSLTSEVEDVMKRICSNSKVGFTVQAVSKNASYVHVWFFNPKNVFIGSSVDWNNYWF